MKIKNIRKINNEPVYNLTVKKHHNYLTSNGLILKNCDSLRYYCVNFTYPTERIKEDKYRLPYAFRDESEDIGTGGMIEW